MESQSIPSARISVTLAAIRATQGRANASNFGMRLPPLSRVAAAASARLPALGAWGRASHIEALFGAAARIGPCRQDFAQVAIHGRGLFAAKMPD
jgi:hypothetical protein